MSYVIGSLDMTRHGRLLVSHKDQYCSFQAAPAVE